MAEPVQTRPSGIAARFPTGAISPSRWRSVVRRAIGVRGQGTAWRPDLSFTRTGSPEPANPRFDKRSGDVPRTAAEAARSSYYGVPVVHKPHWKWLIIVYFFLGGISGAAYVLAAIADTLDPTNNRPIVRAGRYVSFAALLPSPILLILDLGKPERFLMMFRVLKLRSPMSLGTWALTLFGGFSAFAALGQAASHRLPVLQRSSWSPSPRRLRAVSIAGSPIALFVAGYTGVLLAATAVPLWTKRARFLGPIFLSSAFTTAAAAVSLFLPGGSDRHETSRDRLERVETLSSLAELALLATWLHRLGPTAAPLSQGRTATVFRHGTLTAGFVVPLLLSTIRSVLPRRASSLLGYVASACALAGGFALRYAVVVAGGASADDPAATFETTRAPDHSTGAVASSLPGAALTRS